MYPCNGLTPFFGPPATIRKLSRFQKRKGLATFSEAVTAAAELV